MKEPNYWMYLVDCYDVFRLAVFHAHHSRCKKQTEFIAYLPNLNLSIIEGIMWYDLDRI